MRTYTPVYARTNIVSKKSEKLYFLFLEDFLAVDFLVDFLVEVFFAVLFVAVVVVFAGATYLVKDNPLFIPSKLFASEETVLSVLLLESLLTLPTTSRSLELSNVSERLPFSICA
jgi:hypothetical protein